MTARKKFESCWLCDVKQINLLNHFSYGKQSMCAREGEIKRERSFQSFFSAHRIRFKTNDHTKPAFMQMNTYGNG